LSSKGSSHSGKSGATAATNAGRAAGPTDDPRLIAQVVPLIAEIGGHAKDLVAALGESPGPRAQAAEIVAAVESIWGILLGKKISRLAVPPEAVGEMLAVLERYGAGVS